MTLNDALAYIQNKGREFAESGPRIHDGMHAAAVYAGSLPQGPDREEARKVVGRWGDLLRAQQTALNRWDALADRIPGLDGMLGVFPVVPVALAASVIAVAASIGIILRRLTAEERALRLLQQGRITPAQAVELAKNLEGKGPTATLFGMPAWLPIAAGVGLYFLSQGKGGGARWL